MRARRGNVVRLDGNYAGAPYGVVDSGLHFIVPFTHSIHKVNTGDRSDGILNVINIGGEGSGAQLLIQSRLSWAIRRDGYNPIIALIKAATEGDIREGIVGATQSAINTVGIATPRRTLNDSRIMTGLVNEVVEDRLLEYGVRMRRLEILSVSETFGQMVREAGASGVVRGAEFGDIDPMDRLEDMLGINIPAQMMPTTQAI